MLEPVLGTRVPREGIFHASLLEMVLVRAKLCLERCVQIYRIPLGFDLSLRVSLSRLVRGTYSFDLLVEFSELLVFFFHQVLYEYLVFPLLLFSFSFVDNILLFLFQNSLLFRRCVVPNIFRVVPCCDHGFDPVLPISFDQVCAFPRS